MALSRAEAYPGIRFPTNEKTKPDVLLKPRLTPSEIGRIMTTIPPELKVDNPIKTHVGTWVVEDRPVFYAASAQSIAEVSIPERKDRIINRVKTAAKVIFQLS